MWADQRDRQTFGTGTAGTTNPVQVVITAARHIKVDHAIQLNDIQTASRNVSRDQNAVGTLLEAFNRHVAVFLILLAVQHVDTQIERAQHPVDAISHYPGVGEDNGLAFALIQHQPLEHGFLVGVVIRRDNLLGDTRSIVAYRVQLQNLRLGQHRVDHPLQAAIAFGRGEQHGLTLRRASLGQLADILGKAHIQHAVGFIQYQRLYRGQLQIAGRELFQRTPRRCNHNVRILAQARCLHLEVFATGDLLCLEKGELRQRGNILQHLPGQLAGRHQNQAARRQRLAVIQQQPLQHGQHVGGGLAAAGLRNHVKVAPLDSSRNRLLLHLGGLLERQFGKRFKQALMQLEFAEQKSHSVG